MKVKLVKALALFLILGLLSSCVQQRCVGGSCAVKQRSTFHQTRPLTPGEMIAIGGGSILGGGFLFIYLVNTLGTDH